MQSSILIRRHKRHLFSNWTAKMQSHARRCKVCKSIFCYFLYFVLFIKFKPQLIWYQSKWRLKGSCWCTCYYITNSIRWRKNDVIVIIYYIINEERVKNWNERKWNGKRTNNNVRAKLKAGTSCCCCCIDSIMLACLIVFVKSDWISAGAVCLVACISTITTDSKLISREDRLRRINNEL